jgi:hypothetical protein
MMTAPVTNWSVRNPVATRQLRVGKSGVEASVWTEDDSAGPGASKARAFELLVRPVCQSATAGPV